MATTPAAWRTSVRSASAAALLDRAARAARRRRAGCSAGAGSSPATCPCRGCTSATPRSPPMASIEITMSPVPQALPAGRSGLSRRSFRTNLARAGFRRLRRRDRPLRPAPRPRGRRSGRRRRRRGAGGAARRSSGTRWGCRDQRVMRPAHAALGARDLALRNSHLSTSISAGPLPGTSIRRPARRSRCGARCHAHGRRTGQENEARNIPIARRARKAPPASISRSARPFCRAAPPARRRAWPRSSSAAPAGGGRPEASRRACAGRRAAPAPAPRSRRARGRCGRRAARSRRPRRGRRRARPRGGAASGSQVRRTGWSMRVVTGSRVTTQVCTTVAPSRPSSCQPPPRQRRRAGRAKRSLRTACAPSSRASAARLGRRSGAMSKAKSSRSRSCRSSITRANSGLSGAWGMSSGIVRPSGPATARAPGPSSLNLDHARE